MMTNAAVLPLPSNSLEHLSDAELLSTTRSLIGRSNQLLAALLAHLAEVEARGVHRTRACSSLYVYCIYELRLSEDEAFRRVSAARLVRRFPVLLEAIATGELHLTGLLMLGPHLTEHNVTEVLARAKHRTKKELARLVRSLDPLPDVPGRIEPLGPAPTRLVPPAGTWEALTEALSGPVRELKPGDRPRDWMGTHQANEPDGPDAANEGAAQPSAPARVDSTESINPQRYKVQFTATEEYVSLFERAKALLSHALPNASLEEVQLRALRAYVAQLEKQKYALAARPPTGSNEECAAVPAALAGKQTPRRRGRRIPAAVRRAVFERDGGRCSYVDEHGTRCRETHGLELDHEKAFATGGEHSEQNLSLKCKAHNALAAEQDFGRPFMDDKRDALRHERFASEKRRSR